MMNNIKKEDLLSESFIKKIPKTDLHLHLDGSLRINTLIELAKDYRINLPSYTEDGLKKIVFKDQYTSLNEYLTGFAHTCSVMRTKEAIKRVAYELAIDNQNEGVRYIEVRFAPQLHIHDDLSFEEIMISCNDGLKQAKDEFNSKEEIKNNIEPPFNYGIIVCSMRYVTPAFSPFYKKLFEAHAFSNPKQVTILASEELAKASVKIIRDKDIPLVGFDLAGAEAGYPAEDHKMAYEIVHRNFIHKTVHAGEAYGPESIFQAISDLHADRIGHGFYLYDTNKISDKRKDYAESYVKNLVRYIANSRITIEICLTSNLQTNPNLKNNIKNHTFKKMLEDKISLTLCTDNRLVSNTTVSREYDLAIRNFDISINQIKNFIAYGFKRSFFHGSYKQKRDYVRKNLLFFEKIVEEEILGDK